jgi:glycosyltransferase involved in cell wall biosynthesis
MKFSIVTPSFRQLDWLKLCIASVADQPVDFSIEHIIQDGGSEGIEGLANRKNPKDYQLKLFIEKDEGMYDAINRGLRRATGDICAYLNCDEQYLPGALDRVKSFFNQHPEVDILFGDVICTDRDGSPVCYRRMVAPSLLHTRILPLGTLTCSTFFRRTLVERGFLFDTSWKTRGDAVWVFNLLKAKIRTGVLSEPLASFAFTGENQSDSPAALADRTRWHENDGRSTKGLRALAALHHRWRKFLAGAYQSRDVALPLYSFKDPSQRTVHRKKVGYRWPGSTI